MGVEDLKPKQQNNNNNNKILGNEGTLYITRAVTADSPTIVKGIDKYTF